MPDLKGEIWFHELPLKREIKAGKEETGGIRKENGFKYFVRVYLATYRIEMLGALTHFFYFLWKF